jgi:hypothetical protein
MFTEVQFNEYLDRIRRQVCSRCPEHPPDGAGGKGCGVEAHLTRLVGALHGVGDDDRGEPSLDQARAEVCAECALQHRKGSPCPMDYLAVLVVEAKETADPCREQWEYVRRRRSCRARANKVPVREMCRAYEEATGTFIGCD